MTAAIRWTIAAALALGAFGCAASGSHAPPAAPGPRASMAMLPLENLSGRAENGEKYSRVVWSVLGRTNRYDLTDPGEVEAALGELRIRSTGAIARDQMVRIAERLRVRWILAGSLLESGSIRTPDGDVPSFSLSLRVIDGRSGQVTWSDLIARSGQDRETIFGWGREESLDRLADATARELVDRIRMPEFPDSLTTREGKP